MEDITEEQQRGEGRREQGRKEGEEERRGQRREGDAGERWAEGYAVVWRWRGPVREESQDCQVRHCGAEEEAAAHTRVERNMEVTVACAGAQGGEGYDEVEMQWSASRIGALRSLLLVTIGGLRVECGTEG